MSFIFFVIIFFGSCIVLSWLSGRLVKSLVSMAHYLNWREFIIAFFVMSVAVSLPNLFTDFNAALQGKPELAFGDIIGGNLVDLTFVLAIAVFFSKKGLSAESQMVQRSAIFTTLIAILPLLLIFDANLSRADGLILIASFFLYAWWIFSEKENFKARYSSQHKTASLGFRGFVKSLLSILILLVLLLGASFAVVGSAQFFADKLGISLALVGILILGLGNAFPEGYFAVISARKEKNWLVLGDLMGSVIVCSTLVLGLIAFFLPFEIKDFAPFATARIFLVISAVFVLIFIRSGKKITKKEGLILLLIYVIFLLVEVFMK